MTPTDRALWFSQRQSSAALRRRWRASEIAKLEALVGKLTLPQMAQALGRRENSVASKLQSLGYLIQQDIHQPLGLSAIGLARRLRLPYEVIWRAVRSGQIPAQRLRTHKDYLIRWPAVRRAESHFVRLQQRRERALARLHEPTITKQAFMKLIGLSETHVARYLQGGVVRAWKIPCLYSDVGRHRWEWRVSRSDAHRVKRLRESGRLRLNTRAYRALQRQNNAHITTLRRERRLGLRAARGPRASVVPSGFSVGQVAQQANLSESQVYSHVRLGRLKSKRVRVGQRAFIVISPKSLSAYLDWCQRDVKATGPLRPRQTQIEQVRRAGRLTVSDAAEKYGLNRGTLAAAVQRGDLPSETIANLRALRARDVRRYLKHCRPKKH